MHGVLRIAVLVVLWLATGAAMSLAQVPETARRAYADGRYLTAATLAETDGSADALAFAARARIADAITRAEGLCHDCLLQAEATAEEAIKRNAGLAEAYVQLAIAIGFRGRLVSTFEAQSESLAERGRAAIDQALALDPANAWARASLGGWHLEIVHRAGSLLAAVLYDASEEEGLRNFRSALARDPHSLLLHYHYALSILALDPERFRDEALTTLEAGGEDPRTDALVAFTRARADALIQELRDGSSDEVARLVHRFQGYSDQTMKAGVR